MKDQTFKSYFDETKWVRIMCDHCADGVWGKDGAAYEAADISVSTETSDRIDLWQKKYELMADSNPSEAELASFSAEGLAIARAVKLEHPDWVVVYFDESRALSHKGHDRSAFEYEIEAEAASRS